MCFLLSADPLQEFRRYVLIQAVPLRLRPQRELGKDGPPTIGYLIKQPAVLARVVNECYCGVSVATITCR